MELKLSAVEQAAKEKNGWHAVAIYKNRHIEDTLPHGTIAFVRHAANRPEKLCGTADWAINDIGVFFYAGHYDMERDEAIEDFNHRVARFVREAV